MQRVCNYPSCHTASAGLKLSKCGRCFKALYCSQQCQQKDWPTHKQTCKLTTKMHEAVKSNDVGLLEQLVTKQPELAKQNDGDGKIPLYHAAEKSHVIMVTLLVKISPLVRLAADPDKLAIAFTIGGKKHIDTPEGNEVAKIIEESYKERSGDFLNPNFLKALQDYALTGSVATMRQLLDSGEVKINDVCNKAEETAIGHAFAIEKMLDKEFEGQKHTALVKLMFEYGKPDFL